MDAYLPLYLNEPPKDCNGDFHTAMAKVWRMERNCAGFRKVALIAYGDTRDSAYGALSAKLDEYTQGGFALQELQTS